MSYMSGRLQRGFSLLEMTLAVGVSGILLSGLWQMSGMADRNLQANFLATHAMTVAIAGQNYLTANKTAVLAMVPAIGDVARIKVVTADASGNTPSLQAAGLLPANFVNSNSYGQSYAFYALREDSGTLGSADSGDRLIGLLITTGGTAIDDKVGSALASKVGAAGGFLYSDNNPASPTAATTASGVAGGWSLDLSSGDWPSAVGATATAGHIAILAALLPGGAGAGGGGAADIDGLSDGKTDYSTLYNVFLGSGAGAVATGANNTATGYQALTANTTGAGNIALGAYALRRNTTGSYNIAIGYNAYINSYFGTAITGSNNIAIGAGTMSACRTESNSVVIGTSAGGDYSCGANMVAVGTQALKQWGAAIANDNTVAIGYMAWSGGGTQSAVVGGSTGNFGTQAGSYSAVLGYNALYKANNADYSVAVGWQSLYSNTTADYNVAVGAQALYSNTTGTSNSATGYQALYSNTTSSYNSAFGASALAFNTGTANSAFGFQTLYNSTTGASNTALGYQALYTNSTGSQNVAIGQSALSASTTSGQNTAVGAEALRLNTTGTSNAAFGYQALYSNVTANQNSAFGYQALYSNTTSYNSAFGYQSLYSNTTGQYNAAFGRNALRANATTNYNTAVGDSALMANTSNYNTAVGSFALTSNLGGSSNTAMGQFALYNNTTGVDNTAVGVQALYANVSGGQNAAFGKYALNNNTGSNNTSVGMYSLSLNTSGSQNTAVGEEALYNNLTSNGNSAVGYQALVSNTTGIGNTALGYRAGYTGTALTTGSSNTFIGYETGTNAAGRTNSTALGNGASTTADNQIVLGNTSITEIRAQVTTITAISDRRRKHDIEALPEGMAFIDRLKPVQYRYTNGDNTLRYGFIAQDLVAALSPELATMAETGKAGESLALVHRDTDPDHTYVAAYGELIAPTVKALQELHAQTQAQGVAIDSLKGECMTKEAVQALVAAEVAKALAARQAQ